MLDNIKHNIDKEKRTKTLRILMSIMDADIDEDGNIICRTCGLFNECCTCGMDKC